IQCIMVALVCLFPQMVMHYKSSAVQLDQQQINKQFDSIQIPGLGGSGPGGGLPGLDLNAPPTLNLQ
ncbi:C4-dicarboxylate ABC transporter, partial [Bosea sp. ZW T0_25]|nr:C4-dicarboxylate ABC transporter [Bosea sp. ZW T0_25]